jgi:hypothetical protein
MDIFLFGSVWFWLFLCVAVVLMMTATEKGSGWGASITFLLTVAVLYFFGNHAPLTALFVYCIGHPWTTLSVIAGYFIIGTCWAIIKWYFFLIDKRDKVQEERPTYVYVPNVTEHKGKIMLWMSYWPFSAVWTVVDHPVKSAFLFIYNRIKNRMQKMADKIFAPVVQEHEKREESRRHSRSGN